MSQEGAFTPPISPSPRLCLWISILLCVCLLHLPYPPSPLLLLTIYTLTHTCPPPLAVRHSFDTVMFRSIWGPCVHALGVVLEHAEGEATARAALDGLQLAAR